MNPYEVLGVSARASKADIGAAYKQLVKQLHPDHNAASDAAQRFQEVHEAYKQIQEIVSYVATRVIVTLEDVALGGDVVGKTVDKCVTCYGAGGTQKYSCTKCFGDKVVWIGNTQRKCKKCLGRGYFFVKLCSDCNGRGVTIDEYPITIQRGCKTGDKVGETTIEVVRHDRFVRNGLDLELTEDLSILRAIKGGEVNVLLLNKREIKVTIDPYTDSDYVTNLRGYGLQDHGNRKGNLRIRFRIVTPKTIEETNQLVRLLSVTAP